MTFARLLLAWCPSSPKNFHHLSHSQRTRGQSNSGVLFQTLIHHCRCWGLWSGPTDIALGGGPLLPTTTWTRQFQHVLEPPTSPPPYPVTSQRTLVWVTTGSLKLRRDGPVVSAQISKAFPRGRRRTHSRQCSLASVLVTPCTVLTLIRPRNKPSGAPPLLSSFFLPTPGPVTTGDQRRPASGSYNRGSKLCCAGLHPNECF